MLLTTNPMVGDIHGRDDDAALRTAFGNLPYAFFGVFGSLGYSDADFPSSADPWIVGLEETHVVYEPVSRYA